MELLIIRHAIAEDGAETTRSDDERRLTTEGRKKMRLGARGLTRVVPDLAVLASSPLVRARQTADIVARAYGGLDVTTAAELAPDGSPNAVAAWLNRRRADGVVALVGHEPALSNLVSWLLSGAARPLIEMKKGAACLLAFPGGKAGPGTAVLRWALTPAQLRDLGA
jgi:phosphohistidine phosphatase